MRLESIDLQGKYLAAVRVLTPSVTQNALAIANANLVSLQPTASLGINGIAGGTQGRIITLCNDSTDRLIWLGHKSPSAAGGDEINLPLLMPYFMMPGDTVVLRYTAAGRWEMLNNTPGSPVGLARICDFIVSPTDGLNSLLTGVGAAIQQSDYLINSSEAPAGVTRLTTGTQATGRATLGHLLTGDLVARHGALLGVARMAFEVTVSGAQQYEVVTGFADNAVGNVQDGIYWKYRLNVATPELAHGRANNGTETLSAVGSPTPDNNYIWLGVFVTPDGSRADYIYSTDSREYTLAEEVTTGLPALNRTFGWMPASIRKIAGTTARNLSVDFAGYRVDHQRG